MDESFINEFILTPGQVIVDVRTPEEYNEGHIEGAILIPLQHLIRGHLLSFLKEQNIVAVYCAHGVRSWQATLYLQHHKIETIDLGGISDYTGQLIVNENEHPL